MTNTFITEFTNANKDNNYDMEWCDLVHEWTYDQCLAFYNSDELRDQFYPRAKVYLKSVLERQMDLLQSVNFIHDLDQAGVESWRMFSNFGSVDFIIIKLNRELSDDEVLHLDKIDNCDISPRHIQLRKYKNFDKDVKHIFQYVNDNTIAMYQLDGQYFKESEEKFNLTYKPVQN